MSVIKGMPFLRLPSVMLLVFMVSACAPKPDPVAMVEPAAAPVAAAKYDMNSWKSIIADECHSFFDGCNNCFRVPGEMAACTRKACFDYQQPRCRDEAQAANPEQQAAAKLVEYVCDDAMRFSVSYHEFVQDDQRVRLQESEIMFSDHQTRSDLRLQRVPSASGERYADSAGFEFFAKGDEALVMQNDRRLYSACSLQR